MPKKYQIWWKTLTFQQCSTNSNWTNAKRTTLLCIIIKLLKAKGKERISKTAREKYHDIKGKNMINS